MNRPMRLIALGALLGLLSQPAAAFQETTVGGGAQKAAPIAEPPKGPLLEVPKGAADGGKILNLTIPEVTIGKPSGTEVRIPGLGKIGVLPPLDFGLELLYGANDPKGPAPNDKLDQNDLQIRGTIKHRF
jgi:hypothetical protein